MNTPLLNCDIGVSFGAWTWSALGGRSGYLKTGTLADPFDFFR